jgi:hypothetical protein
VTALVETVNVAEVAPVGTVTVAGTLATLESHDSAMTAPPAGAADERVTVP